MFSWRRACFKRPASVAILVVLLGVPAVGLWSAPFAYADHNSMYIVCPPPISEGESDHMQVRRPGYKMISVTVFTYQGGYTADGSDYVSYERTPLVNQTDSTSLWVPVLTKEDSKTEHDETFAIGFWDGGLWHGCVITIEDDDTPQITDLEITSMPVNGVTYRTGESIDITVDLDREAEVEGTPLLSLFLGERKETTWRGARYHRGSGSKHLTFRYQVQPADRDVDGLNVGSAGVDDDGNPAYGFSGRIFAKGTDVPIDYTHPGIATSPGHRVDGRPFVQNIAVTSSLPSGQSAYRANQTIEISVYFNIEVEVEGEPRQGLQVGSDRTNWAEAHRDADYLRGSGTDILVFGYTVRPGDMDERGIKIGFGNPDNGIPRRGSVRAKGSDVQMNPYYPGTGHQEDHKVDAVAPTIRSISIKSRPGDGTAYDVGELVEVEVAFSEEVTASGDPQLKLDIGGTTRQAEPVTRTNGEGAFAGMMVFQYQVQTGDRDTDGIGIDANSLDLNGGSIGDRAGNAAGLGHESVAADPSQKVDASPGN